MNAQPITITATVACWVAKYSQRDLTNCMESGDGVAATNALVFYGKPERETFSDYLRVGEADITVRLIPHDEQNRLMVKALQEQLTEERLKWHQRQESILAEISKYSALEYVAEAA
jgi:hypothetical protein